MTPKAAKVPPDRRRSLTSTLLALVSKSRSSGTRRLVSTATSAQTGVHHGALPDLKVEPVRLEVGGQHKALPVSARNAHAVPLGLRVFVRGILGQPNQLLDLACPPVLPGCIGLPGQELPPGCRPVTRRRRTRLSTAELDDSCVASFLGQTLTRPGGVPALAYCTGSATAELGRCGDGL